MKAITLQDLQKMCVPAVGQISHIYNHWTAGRYDQLFDDYHLSIKGDGSLWASTDDLTEHKSHTYMRNTGAIGVALCACLDAVGCDDLGTYPPTEAQLNTLAQVNAILCIDLGIPLDIQHVMTHAEAADCKDGWYPHEPYGPDSTCERWDLLVLKEGRPRWSGGDELRGNARFYAHQWGAMYI